MADDVTLIYFDTRGRAQFLRYYLHCRDQRFEDHRVPLRADYSEWLAIRSDRSLAGPFQKLPVLRWGERVIPEMLAIRAFLHKTLGDEASLSAEEDLRHTTLTSSLYIDVMMPIGTLIWAEAMYPGADLAVAAKRTLERLRGHLAALERTLDEWRWFEQAAERPVMLADCLLWEELSVAQRVFGDRLELHALPRLAQFFAESPIRSVAEPILRDHSTRITGLITEADTLAKLSTLLG